MPIGCRPLEMPALALKSMPKPQSLPASYQTKPPNAGIMLTSVSRLAAKTETVDTGSTFRAGSNTLRFANYFASGTGEDNAGTEMSEVSTFGGTTLCHGGATICHLIYTQKRLLSVNFYLY